MRVFVEDKTLVKVHHKIPIYLRNNLRNKTKIDSTIPVIGTINYYYATTLCTTTTTSHELFFFDKHDYSCQFGIDV